MAIFLSKHLNPNVVLTRFVDFIGNVFAMKVSNTPCLLTQRR